MRGWLVGLLVVVMVGCQYPVIPSRTLIEPPRLWPVSTNRPNPTLIPANDPEELWERIVWVVSRDFFIEREERPTAFRRGYLETEPKASATLMEPWRGDVAGSYERLESTLQTMRRRVIVTMTAAEGGWLVEVAAYKELENLVIPTGPTSIGSAQFDFGEPVGSSIVAPESEGPPASPNWIPQGRDPMLEGTILGRILD